MEAFAHISAQVAQTADQVDDLLRRCNEALGQLHVPTLEEYLFEMQRMSTWHAIMLVGVGIFYLLLGWRGFKALVALNAAVLGAMIGGMVAVQLGYGGQWPIGMGIGAVVLAILVWPLMKLFVVLFAGAAGAMLGYAGFQNIAIQAGAAEALPYAWIGAVGGAVVLGVLGLLLLRAAAMIFTSLQGAVLLVSGGLALALDHEQTRQPVLDFIHTRPVSLLLTVVGVALAGLILQLLTARKYSKSVEVPPAEGNSSASKKST
jgi:hypothetical protein